jgi:PIN domain nuclease of toxin-antitoxin system
VKYLLDTHVVDWTARRNPTLPQNIVELLANSDGDALAVSDVTLSELSRHLASGAIETKFPPAEWLRQALKQIQILPVTSAIALRAAYLDWDIHGRQHRDPCDRHIVATAMEHGLPLITIDRQMHALSKLTELKIVW